MKKTVKDLKIGDKVWVYGTGCNGKTVEVYYVCSIRMSENTSYLRYGRWYDKKNKLYTCPPNPSDPGQSLVQAISSSNSTSTEFGMYSATVYLNIQDVLDRFEHDIESLKQNIQKFIKENKLKNEN